MKTIRDDPRLTAHAAGESDPELARELARPENGELRREVEDLSAFLAGLRGALADARPEMAGLDPSRREKLLALAASASSPPFATDGGALACRLQEPASMSSPFSFRRASAIAAGVLFVLTLGIILGRSTVAPLGAIPALDHRLAVDRGDAADRHAGFAGWREQRTSSAELSDPVDIQASPPPKLSNPGEAASAPESAAAVFPSAFLREEAPSPTPSRIGGTDKDNFRRDQADQEVIAAPALLGMRKNGRVTIGGDIRVAPPTAAAGRPAAEDEAAGGMRARAMPGQSHSPVAPESARQTVIRPGAAADCITVSPAPARQTVARGRDGEAPPPGQQVDEATGYILPPRLMPAPPAGAADSFDEFTENDFVAVRDQPFSTFAVETDSASYTLVRRFLREGRTPPRSAVRLEELINYFPYNYASPVDPRDAFAVHAEAASCPWAPDRLLLRVALKGKTFPETARPALNLTFLVDVSGSMAGPTRLDLVKSSLSKLVGRLDDRDRISVVTYANAVHTVASGIPGDRRNALLAIIADLSAGGGTAGGSGLQRAYELARRNYRPGEVNRVLLCTDGDFNIGITDRGELGRYVENEARANHIFLSALGFGMGNHKDAMLETLARHGRGNHAYIDDARAADKVLVDEMLGSLAAIAKDVKIQVEFNPLAVAGYRLLGYENRLLAKADFDDDGKMGGTIGAGHAVTALYELIPAGDDSGGSGGSRYQRPGEPTDAARAGELALVRLRDQTPDGNESRLREYPVRRPVDGGRLSPDFRFAAAVAAWGMVLRDSAHKGGADMDKVLEWARQALADDAYDPGGHRREFIDLVERFRPVGGRRREM